mgnify:CR=1 FL=1
MKNTNDHKHHYRLVMKSDHLGSADLEEFIEEKKPLIFTIKHVRQEYGVMVAGKKGDFNIAYFVEAIKPMVLNATNAKIIRGFAGGSPMVEDWNQIPIELYIDENVRFGKDTVSGVRIRPLQPKTKAKPFFTDANFDKAKKAGATIDMIKHSYQITPEVEAAYLKYELPSKTPA